jgi:hypothetical protein
MKRFAAVWGFVGVFALCAEAVWRLWSHAKDALTAELDAVQIAVAAVWMAFMGVVEGYRGFHQKFSPRVVARAEHLAKHARPIDAVLAPLFCMSLYGASRRGLLVARILVAGIVVLIILVPYLPHPWRGIVDAGVVVGLGIGLMSMTYFGVRSLRGLPPAIEPDLPGPEQSAR